MKDDIYASEELTCSIGIAPNKILAKIASDSDKPNGLVVVKPLYISEFLAPLKITIIPGIGKKSFEIFQKENIILCKDLAKLPHQLVYQKFGKYGLKTWKLVNGYNTESTEENFVSQERKSISEERTFFDRYSSWEEILTRVEASIDTIISRLTIKKMSFKTITLKIRFKNFETYTRAHSLTSYNTSPKHVLVAVKKLLEEFENKKPEDIRLIGVKISNLMKINDNQKTLTQFFNNID